MKKQAVSTSSGFNPYATNNLVVYFGHSSGKSDANISDLCTDPSISIIIIGFLRQFNGLHSPPSVDFGPHCKFQNLTSAPCPDFAASVQACQSVYQKKIFISIGGSSRGITFDGETGAKDAAEVLWNVFGAGTNVPTWRPFGTLVVDGFDIGRFIQSQSLHSADTEIDSLSHKTMKTVLAITTIRLPLLYDRISVVQQKHLRLVPSILSQLPRYALTRLQYCQKSCMRN